MSVDSRGRYTPEAAGAAVPDAEGPAGSRSYNPISTRRASLMQEPVLVLNATYEPINVTAVRRAMVLMLKAWHKRKSYIVLRCIRRHTRTEFPP